MQSRQMDLMLLRVFQQQVLLQCRYVLVSAKYLQDANQHHDTVAVFYAIQNLLTAAANVAKALWGQKGSKAVDRGALRLSIGVNDSSPLRLVTMRNNFEHFDDRLDKWWRDSFRHNHADLNIGPKDAIAGLDDIDRFRMFDPTSTDVIFWGETFNLNALIDEVARICPLLEEEANRPHWEPSPGQRTEP